MRRRTALILIATISALCGTFGLIALLNQARKAGTAEWVEYTPVVLGDLRRAGPLYEVAPEINTPKHKQALIRVLQLYGEEFSESEGTVFIRPRLAHDQDLLMNYSQKAEEVVNGGGGYMFR